MNMNRMIMVSFTVWKLRRASCKLGKNLLFSHLLFGIKYILNITLSLSQLLLICLSLFVSRKFPHGYNSCFNLSNITFWYSWFLTVQCLLFLCLLASGHLVYPGQITCSGLYYSIDLCKGKHNMFPWRSLRLKHASGFAIKNISIYGAQWILENM